jgi:monoamine oxidase
VRPFGRALVECYFGGGFARDLEREGAGAAVAFAADELAGHFGNNVRNRLTLAACSAWGREPHILGSYSYAKPGAADGRAVLAAPVDERLFFAGEACSPARFSTAHGAYESGVTAAEQVPASLVR